MGRHPLLVVRHVDDRLPGFSLCDGEMPPSFLTCMQKEVDNVKGEADYISM